jgi:hypothetical protein
MARRQVAQISHFSTFWQAITVAVLALAIVAIVRTLGIAAADAIYKKTRSRGTGYRIILIVATISILVLSIVGVTTWLIMSHLRLYYRGSAARPKCIPPGGPFRYGRGVTVSELQAVSAWTWHAARIETISQAACWRICGLSSLTPFRAEHVFIVL